MSFVRFEKCIGFAYVNTLRGVQFLSYYSLVYMDYLIFRAVRWS
jgi:hypothetical protein